MIEPAWARHLPVGTAPGSVDLTRRQTLPRALVERWRAHPDQPVILDAAAGWITTGDLLDRTHAAAARLAAAGLQPGDRVLVSGSASIDLVVAHVAALRAGLVVVPVNPAYSRRELEVIIGDARPRAAVVGRPELREWIAEIDDTVAVTDIDLDALPNAGANGAEPELELAFLTRADDATVYVRARVVDMAEHRMLARGTE